MTRIEFSRRSPARLVAGRDLRDAASDLRLSLAMVGLALTIPILTAVGIHALNYFGQGTQVVDRLSVVGAFFVTFLPASFSLVLALESFVGERERSTLEVLLSTPLREADIYAGKVVSVLAISLVLCFGALTVYSLAVFPFIGYVPVAVLVSLAVSTICQVAAMVAGAVIISANARTMRAANVMASFIILPMSFVLELEAALILVGRGDIMWAFTVLMALLAFALLRMGLAGFNREALLSREAGGRRLASRISRAVNEAFRGRPGFFRLVGSRVMPIGIAAFALVTGLATGYLAGAANAISVPVAKPVLESLLQQAPATSPAGLTIDFFTHNVTAILLAGLLAGLTIGLTGFLLNYLPGFFIGYAAALSSWPLALNSLLPNGIIEIPATLIAGALMIEIGAAMIHMESGGGWAQRVLVRYADLARSLRWLIPALAVAAVLEAFRS